MRKPAPCGRTGKTDTSIAGCCRAPAMLVSADGNEMATISRLAERSPELSEVNPRDWRRRLCAGAQIRHGSHNVWEASCANTAATGLARR
jgi:hypothetical protein